MEYVEASPGGGFYVWKEQDGTKILRANGLDEWLMVLDASGAGRSDVYFSSDDMENLAGRACPDTVYVDSTNLFSTTDCLYYDSGNPGQTLNADQSILRTTGVSSNHLNLALWYYTNINVCANKGMRLPVFFETQGYISSASYLTRQINNQGNPGIGDKNNGVPSYIGQTWTGTTAESGADNKYYSWSGTGYSYPFCYNANYIRCVIP